MNEKKLKLQQKSQANLQKLINAAIDFVDEARDIEERIREIDEVEKKNEKK